MKKLVIVVAAVIYLFWPLDLIPDVIPLAGWCDDIFAAFLGFKALINKK